MIHTAIQKRGWTNHAEYFVIPTKSQYDILLMGSSHGWVLTHYKNKEKTEQILNHSISNLSQLNAGPVIEKVYLKYFLTKGNSAKKIVYVIDPFVFYSSKYNEHNIEVLYTKLDPLFLGLLMQEGVKNDVISYNLMKYFSLKWFYQKPTPETTQKEIVTDLSAKKKGDRLAGLYSDGTDAKQFQRNVRKLEEIVSIAQKNNVPLIFVTPPTLLNDPQMPQLKLFLEKMKKQKNIQYYTFSDSMPNAKYYFDTDHLNSDGVEVFSKKYLFPILSNTATPQTK